MSIATTSYNFYAEHRSAIPTPARRVLIGCVIAAHGLVGWALLHIATGHIKIEQAAPTIFAINWIAPEAPTAASPKPPAPSEAKRQSAMPMIAIPEMSALAINAPSDSIAVAAQPETQPAASEAPVAPPMALSAPVATTPKVVPASAVTYLEPPVVKYPSLSRRLGETGRVLLRVLIDVEGRAQQVEIAESSGVQRLDEAAVSAMQRTRFKPYSQNDIAQAVWTFAPITFTLDN